MSALGSCADGLSASEAAGMNFSGVGAQPPLEPRCSATVAESVVLIRDRAAPRKSVLAPVEVYAPTPAVQRQLGLDVHRSVKCSALLKGAKVFITWTPPASPGSSSCGSESPPLSGVNLLAEANLLPSFLPRALQLLLCLRQSQSASPLSAVGPKTGSGASPVNGDRRMQLLEAEAVAAFFRGVTVQQVESLRVQLQGPPPHQHLHQAAASAASLGATSPRSLSCSRSEASEGIALLLPDSSVQHLQRQGSALSVLEFDSSSEAAVPSPPPQPPCAGKFSLLVSRSTAAVLAAASTGAFGRFGGLVSASQQLRALAQTVKEAIAAELVWQLRKLLRASALDVCGQANALVNFRRCTDCLVAHWLPVLLGASPQEVLCVLQSQGVTVSEQSLTAPEPLSLQPPKANTFAPSSAAVSLNAQTAPNAAASRNAANGLVLAPAAAEGRAEQRPAAGFLSGDGGKGELTLSCSEVAALENYFMCVEAMQVDSDDPLPEQFQEARCEPFLQALDLSLCLASPSNSLTVSPNSVPADDAFDLGSIEAAKPGRPSPPKTTSASLSSKTPELAAEAPDPRSAVVSKVLRNILGGAAPPADTKPASSRARRGGRGGGSGGGSDGGCSSVGGGVVVAAAGGGGASPMDVQEAKPGAVEGPSLRRPPLQERFSGRGGLTAAERSALHALLYPSSTSTGEGGAQRNGEGGGKGGRRSVPLHLLPGLFNNCPDFVDRALQVGRWENAAPGPAATPRSLAVLQSCSLAEAQRRAGLWFSGVVVLQSGGVGRLSQSGAQRSCAALRL